MGTLLAAKEALGLSSLEKLMEIGTSKCSDIAAPHPLLPPRASAMYQVPSRCSKGTDCHVNETPMSCKQPACSRPR